jgi:DNA-binding transcriptional regulator YiaG
VVEVDSWEYHRDRDQFESDRDRDATRLAAEIATVRVTWERISLAPQREADRLLAILARRARRVGGRSRAARRRPVARGA